MPPGYSPMPSNQPGEMTGTEEPKVESVLSLKISNNLLTLHAVNASLKSIVEQIGAELKIEVIVYLKDEQTITLDFENLDIIMAIVELSEFANFIYYKDATTGKVKKIMVSPKPQKGHGNV
jgi:type II secretory pathway component GspD/PulD (secretin)